jgi:chemotaxis regulatin CheY-phosphate phosphatase CheZ
MLWKRGPMNTESLDRSLSNCVRTSQLQTAQPDAEEEQAGIIRDFIEHVRGIVPLLEHVKDSISESSSRIPKASMQLSKVTEATELATVEILNVLETMTSRISAGEKDLLAIDEFVKNAGNGEGKEAAQSSIASLGRLLSETKDNSMNITVALQVQDITSQQIAGVSHTIESIRLQLKEALVRFDNPTDTQTGAPEQKSVKTHFDSDASFSKAPDRQDLADEIVKQWTGTHPAQ